MAINSLETPDPDMLEPVPYPPHGSVRPDPEYRLIDVGKFVRLFWRRRYLLVLCSLGCALLGYAAAYLIHPKYDAVVRLTPPDHKDSSILSFSSRNDGDLYLGLLSSRTITDDIIQTLNLSSYFHTSNPTALRKDLESMVKVELDKNQFITVTVRAAEPDTAARIANAYPEALSRMNRTIALAQAEDRWQYYAGPLEQEKDKLAAAEEALKNAQQSTGMVMPEAQVQIGLTSIAALNQQIATREEQLAGLETSSTVQNPQVVALRSEIGSLTAQRNRLQAQNGGSGTPSTAAKNPQLALEVERLTREVKFHETLFEVLSRQYENARVDESYSAPAELIDRAVVPNEKSYPTRRLFLMGGFFLGLTLAILIALIQAYHPFRALGAFLARDPGIKPAGARI